VILLNRKQAVVERLLLDRIPAGTAIASPFSWARGTVVKATARNREDPNHSGTDHNIDHR
jgi:hypothetical protein